MALAKIDKDQRDEQVAVQVKKLKRTEMQRKLKKAKNLKQKTEIEKEIETWEKNVMKSEKREAINKANTAEKLREKMETI